MDILKPTVLFLKWLRRPGSNSWLSGVPGFRDQRESWYRHILPSLDWSRSQHPLNFPVLMSLRLDIQEISQSRWVSVSTSTFAVSVSVSSLRLGHFSLGLGLIIETYTFSVSVSSLRLRPFQSRSGYWDSEIFSLSLSLCLDDPNLVSLIPAGIWLKNFLWKRGIRDLRKTINYM